MPDRLALEPNHGQISENHHAQGQRESTYGAEEVRGPAAVAEQEDDREQIHEAAEKATPAELGIAEASRVVLYRDLADPKALPVRQHGHETMQLAVQAHVFENDVPICFEATVDVVQLHPCRRAHEPIEDARR